MELKKSNFKPHWGNHVIANEHIVNLIIAGDFCLELEKQAIEFSKTFKVYGGFIKQHVIKQYS